jgi:hypothetical protein
MSISLVNIFDNSDLDALSNKYKLACFAAFESWINKEEKKDKNLIAISNLIKAVNSDAIRVNVSTFFFHLLILPSCDLSQGDTYFLFFLFLFDSVGKYISGEMSFPISTTLNGSIFLPCMSIKVNLHPAIERIAKFRDDVIFSGKTSDSYKIKKGNDTGNNIRLAHVENGDLLYQLILSKLANYDQMDASYIDIFYSNLKKAINLIYLVDKGFDRQLSKIEYVIPMAYVSKNVTKSFTLSGLPHVLFISDANSYLKIMENIIHETLHDELNVFMKFYDLHIDNHELYYSPWRDDPRPIRGLIHAIYVFTGIYQYYFNFLQNPAHLSLLSLPEQDHLKFRYNLIHYELELSFMQLASNDLELNALGKKLINKLYDIYKISIGTQINAGYPRSIREHIKKWRLNNVKHKIDLPPALMVEEGIGQ